MPEAISIFHAEAGLVVEIAIREESLAAGCFKIEPMTFIQQPHDGTFNLRCGYSLCIPQMTDGVTLDTVQAGSALCLQMPTQVKQNIALPL